MRRLLCSVLAVAALVFASLCVVVIDERQIGFRTLLGMPEPAPVLGVQLNRPLLLEPGVYLRVPGLQQVATFEKRRQRFDSPRHEPQTAQGELIRLEYYVIWRIDDPRRFFEAFRDSDAAALNQIDNTSYGELRTALGQHSLADLLSERRTGMLRSVVASTRGKLGMQGIEVLDLQIRSLDYPDQNLDQIHRRMRSERERYALRARAEGEEQALAIRSKADERVRVLLAEAEREAQRLRGEGDAEASRIYAEAYGRDPEFYAFARSLEAYRKTIDERTTLILSRDMPFLHYLFEPRAGAPAKAAPTR
jgi:membrane protease subunit HflC